MRSLRASLYKDIRLFLSGAGILSLLLPFLLLPALRWGVADLSAQSYVRAFPVAVRDLDKTVMSRSLISQLSEIELFSEVTVLDDSTSDADAIAQGAAAVATIPLDFFYDLYTMEDCPVTVTVNAGMEPESTIFRAIVRAVMDIIHANQAANIGTYTFVYGDLSEDVARTMYAGAAEDLFRDALGRQQVFAGAIQAADLAGALQRRLAACVLAVMAMFFALSAAKTLPEEITLGVLPRFRALGGRTAGFLFSKFLAAFVLTLPVLALTAVLFPGADILFLFLLDLMLLWAAFGLFTALALWTGDGAAAQRWGNLILLLSLAAGGTIWPLSVLPDAIAGLGKLTLPYYAALGLEARAQGLGLSGTLSLLWPLPAAGAVGAILAVPALRRRGRGGSRAHTMPGPTVSAVGAEPRSFPAAGLLRRLVRLGLFKLRASAGRLPGLAALLAVAVLCGIASAAVRGDSADALRLAVCDLDGTALSQELTASLGEEEAVTCVPAALADARRAMLTGEVEGILIVDPGYAGSLETGAEASLRYEAAGSSLSAQGAREIVAGKVSAQRSRVRAVGQAEAMLGRPLSPEEQQTLQTSIRSLEQTLPPLYELLQEEGPPLSALFAPGQMSFAALAVLFTLLTAASWFGTTGSRTAERRMCAMPRGRLISYGSDCLALSALGTLVALAVLLPAGGVLRQLPAAISYALCAAALALALIRATALAGRVDALAPFLALTLCLAGGCFLDIGALSPAMDAVSLLSPAGLAVRAAEGSPGACGALLAEGALLFFLGMPGKARSAGRL